MFYYVLVVGRKESKVAQDPLRETLGRVNDWKKPGRKRKNLIRLGGLTKTMPSHGVGQEKEDGQ